MNMLKLLELSFWSIIAAATIILTLLGIGNVMLLMFVGVISMYLSVKVYEESID
jgi:hypothetical protein